SAMMRKIRHDSIERYCCRSIAGSRGSDDRMTIAAWTRGRAAATVLAICAAGDAAAREPASFRLTPAARYANPVPPPEAILGHAVGERFSTHEQVGRVVTAIGLASDRVRVVEYGETWAGRPLVYALVSSPGNLARIEEIG